MEKLLCPQPMYTLCQVYHVALIGQRGIISKEQHFVRLNFSPSEKLVDESFPQMIDTMTRCIIAKQRDFLPSPIGWDILPKQKLEFQSVDVGGCRSKNKCIVFLLVFYFSIQCIDYVCARFQKPIQPQDVNCEVKCVQDQSLEFAMTYCAEY